MHIYTINMCIFWKMYIFLQIYLNVNKEYCFKLIFSHSKQSMKANLRNLMNCDFFSINSSPNKKALLLPCRVWPFFSSFKILCFSHLSLYQQINRSQLVNIWLCHANSSHMASCPLLLLYSWTKIFANWSLCKSKGFVQMYLLGKWDVDTLCLCCRKS